MVSLEKDEPPRRQDAKKSLRRNLVFLGVLRVLVVLL